MTTIYTLTTLSAVRAGQRYLFAGYGQQFGCAYCPAVLDTADEAFASAHPIVRGQETPDEADTGRSDPPVWVIGER